MRDTFVVAATQLGGLRDPDRLRPWLHAVARNECLRRRATAGVVSRPPEVPGDGALPAVDPPAALRGEVLAACTDKTPAGRANRASVAHRAGPFGPSGFPKATGSPSWLRGRPRVAAAVATVAVVVAGGLTAMLTAGSPHGVRAATVANGGVLPSLPVTSAGSGNPGTPGRPVASPSRPRAVPAPGQPTPSVTAQASMTSPGSPTRTGAPSPRPSTAPSGPSSSPASSPSASPSASAPPSPSATPTPGPGVLVATPDNLVLTSIKGTAASGTFILSATGGPVTDYVIKVPPGMAGKVRVTPISGSLGDGGGVSVTVTAASKVAVNTDLTVEAGNTTITVFLSIRT